MKTEAALMREIAAAKTLGEQMALVEQLDALKKAQAFATQAARDTDLSATLVGTTLTPVATHTLHTAATDWLSDESDLPDAGVAHQGSLAEAAYWYSRLNPMVKSDRGEFAEQAFGMARRVASKYGEHREAAERAFLDYVAFLQAREAASGLDQIQQTTAPDGVTNKPTPLPEDTFDTFSEPINEFNVGVDEAQSSDNAPLLQEIMQTGPFGVAGPAKPSEHDEQMDTSNGYSEVPPVEASLAINHLMNLDDFRREAATAKGQGVPPFGHEAAATHPDGSTPGPHGISCKYCGEEQSGYAKRGGKDWVRCSNGHAYPASEDPLDGKPKGGPHAAAKEAASGLPQIQQTIDANNQPSTTPLPGDVAFPIVQPWPETSTGEAGAPAEDAIERAEQAGAGQGQAEKPNQHGAAKKGSDLLGLPDAVKATKDYRKAYRYASSWTPGQPLVNTGSKEFEAGIFAGLLDNPQGAAFAEASKASRHASLKQRIAVHAGYLAKVASDAVSTRDLDFERQAGDQNKTAGTAVDLNTSAPSSSPDPSGQTPINGPGTTPELDGGANPAAPGGPAPYNGSQPFGSPVTENPNWLDPQDSTTTQAPMGQPMPFVGPENDVSQSVQTNAMLGFRKRVQAGLLAEMRDRQANG